MPSLVGSEMCIRDRQGNPRRLGPCRQIPQRGRTRTVSPRILHQQNHLQPAESPTVQRRYLSRKSDPTEKGGGEGGDSNHSASQASDVRCAHARQQQQRCLWLVRLFVCLCRLSRYPSWCTLFAVFVGESGTCQGRRVRRWSTPFDGPVKATPLVTFILIGLSAWSDYFH